MTNEEILLHIANAFRSHETLWVPEVSLTAAVCPPKRIDASPSVCWTAALVIGGHKLQGYGGTPAKAMFALLAESVDAPLPLSHHRTLARTLDRLRSELAPAIYDDQAEVAP